MYHKKHNLKGNGNVGYNPTPPNIPGTKNINQCYVVGGIREIKIESEKVFYLRLTPKMAQDPSAVFTIKLASNNLNSFMEIANKEFEIEIL